MLLVLLACAHPAPDDAAARGDDGPEQIDTADASAAVYDPDVLHEVAVTIDPDDWDELRHEERTYYDILGEGCMEGPFESPYAYFPARVTFDGADLGEVAVRKKGLIGSNSHDRPSLRVDVDHYVDGARFAGLEHLVLNNNNQDPSRMRTCLAHAWFARAGLVAPRCSLAHVVVNGVDLGVYDNTEAIDPALVERVTGAAPAAMYEGTLSDFRDGWLATFEAETPDSDGAELEAVRLALEADDDALLDALDAVLHLDGFFTFWAAEAVAGHWDGYNGNTNNFYVYRQPDGRLAFIASGPDATFDSAAPFDPVWAPTTSALANRLIQQRDARERYEAELTRLLTEAWDGPAQLDRIDAWKELARAELSADERRAVRGLRDIVEAKADTLLDAMGGRVSPPALRGEFCWTEVGSATVAFTTTFGSYPTGDLFGGGEADVAYSIQGAEYPSSADGVSIGWADDEQLLWLTISTIGDGVYLAPYVVLDASAYTDGVDLAIDGEHAVGYLLYASPDTGGNFQVAAYLDGYLSFDRAGDTDGARVTGTLVAGVLGSG